MSDDRNPGVDPRFDPAFQRGYDPATPIAESIPAPVARKTVSPPVAPASVSPVARVVPATAPTVVAATVSAASIREIPVLSGDERLPDESDGEAIVESSADGVDVPASRNPFLLLIVVIAVALIAVGIWLFVRSGQAFNSSEVRSQGDYMSLDATIHTAPFIALLGGAAVIGVLFVFASRYRRR